MDRCLILLFYCLFVGHCITTVTSEQVTIIDTRNATSDLGWPSKGAWTEVTNTDETSDVDLRTFEVCKIHRPNQNNWLRTPYLEVGNPERIFVEIRFSIRSCEGFRRIVSCKETFNLYYLPSDTEDNARADHMDADTYTKVDTIATDQRSQPHNINVNTETRAISSLKTRGVFVAFQDTGSCMSIMHVRVYYKTCSETLSDLAWFPVTNTGPEMTSLVDVNGVCVANAVSAVDAPAPMLHCGGEGQWLVPSGTCLCKAGYQPNKYVYKCNECGVNTFKPTDGNGPCLSCPPHSFSVSYGSRVCRCSSGYYRAPDDEDASPCTKPPGTPSDLEAFVNKTSVILTWTGPRDTGGRADVTYSVSCEKCGGLLSSCTKCNERASFHPGKSELTSGRLIIRDLAPHTNYRFKVYSFNGVSGISNYRPKFAQIQIKTNRDAPPIVSPVRVVSTAMRSASLQWEEPPNPSSPIIEYQIQYSSGAGSYTNRTKLNRFKLDRLHPATSYIVKVRARSGAGYGLYNRPTVFRTKNDKSTASPLYFNDDGDSALPSDVENDDAQTEDDATVTRPPTDKDHLIVAVAVACSLLLITLTVLVFLCSRRKRYVKGSAIDLDKYPGFINASVDLVNSRTYVDPSTYEDPYTAVEEFAKEIDLKLVRIEEVIGRGEFGEVCKGSLDPGHLAVALKTLKAGYNNQEKMDFLSEASIMGQFDHPNVIRLEGVVTKSRPLMIITEYMENGSLDTYLKDNDGVLSAGQLTRMMHSIAAGMKYLSGMGYIHRDLAARNVLVNANLDCKVSDFGLSRFLEDVNEEQVAIYTTRGGMIPIRWTAPEAITKRTFSSCSDVWSFGIVMWEVLSHGERPYWEMSNHDVVHFVESGYRLPAPCYCPRVFHKLMLECWNYDLTKRPTFSQMVSLLGHFLEEPDCLADTINPRSTCDQDECIPEMLDLSSLGQWLEEMHLLGYKALMLRHGCVTAEQIMRLTANELNEMGINDTNDVNFLISESEILRYKIEQVHNNSVAV